MAASVVFAVLGAIGFLPLFGGPGYEQSLASGLVVPAAAAIAVALELSNRGDIAPLECVGRGLGAGVALASAAFVTALLHGFRVGFCDFWGGTTFFTLTSAFGALMGGAWGVVAGEVGRGGRCRRACCGVSTIAGTLTG